MNCPICLDPCLVPVEITGFPCFRPDRIHCHSFARFCFHCAARLFELEKAPEGRSVKARCPFCYSETDPRQIRVSPPFRIDWEAVQTSSQEAVDCPSCGLEAETVEELARHCDRSCCACVLPSNHKDEKDCLVCRNTADRDSPLFHLHMTKTHRMNYCVLCTNYTSLSIRRHHKMECLRRIVPCRHCDMSIQALFFADHLIEHLHESKERQSLLEDLLLKEREMYRRMLEECGEFYVKNYQERI